MNCQEYRDMIEDALDISLHGELEMRVRRHLEHCEGCRAYFERRHSEHVLLFKSVNAAYSHLRPPSDGFADRIVREVVARRNARWSWRRIALPRWALIAASLVLMAGFVFAAAVVVEAVVAKDDDSEAMVEGRADLDAQDSPTMNGSLAASSEVPLALSVSYVPSTDSWQPTADNQQPSSNNQLESEKGEKEMTIKHPATVALAAALSATSIAMAEERIWTGATLASVGDMTNTYTYVASEMPTSLGGGAVTFEYSGGAISKMTVSPSADETVEVKGDALAFASGGILAHGGLGTVLISCNMTGVDGLTVTNALGTSSFVEYDGALIAHDSFSTVFEGVDLDDIEIIDSDQTGYDSRISNFSNPNDFYAYNAMRDTVDGVKQMTVEMQSYRSSWTKCVRLLLKQEGANVVAKALSADYVAKDVHGQNFVHLKNVWSANPDSSANVQVGQQPLKGPGDASPGYGICRLRARWLGLPKLYVNGLTTGLGGALTVSENVAVLGADGNSFEKNSLNSVQFNVNGALTLPNRFHSLAKKLSGTNGTMTIAAYNPVRADPYATYMRAGFVTYEATSIDSTSVRHSLLALTNVVGIMSGGSMPYKPAYKDACRMYHLNVTTNGGNSTVATCQLQSQNEASLLRCVKLKFEQSDYTIKVSLVTNWYSGFANGAYYGMDFENPGSVTVTGYARQSNLTPTTSSPFSVSNLVCRFSEPGGYNVTLGVANAMKDVRIVVKGTPDGGRAMAMLNNKDALPSGGIVDIEDGGVLMYVASLTGAGSTSQNTSVRIRVHSGGVLAKYVSAHWAIYRDQNIFLDGGTFEPGYLKSATDDLRCYANNLTMRNGARIAGYRPLWLCNNAATDSIAHWYVTGTSPSVCDIPLQLPAQSGTEQQFLLDVEDTTGDDTADLTFLQPITRYSDNKNVTLCKYGDGIAEARNTVDVTGGITIYDGVFRLGASALTDASAQTVKLSGGTLAAAANTANALGILTVGANGGGIKLGAGATLIFPDCAETAWTAGESVVVTGFRENAIRFGTSATSLVATQRHRFVSQDGKTLRLRENGYLTAVPAGTAIVFR